MIKLYIFKKMQRLYKEDEHAIMDSNELFLLINIR